MKRKIILAVSAAALTSLMASSLYAAPKAVSVGLGSIYTAPPGSEGAAVSGKNFIFFQNIANKNSDILLSAIDQSNNQIWQKVIDSSVDEVATAASIDPQGNIWLAGAAALPSAIETKTPLTGIDNPDLVTINEAGELRGDINQIALWKISGAGELLATYLSPQKSVPLVSAISLTNSGISIIGALDSKPFLLTATTSGVFGKLLFVGSGKSEFNSVVRNSDGSSLIFGSSAETLSGKKVAGVRDGILLKVSKTSSITSLVRSSAKGAARSWISSDGSILLSGPVITGKLIETAITKFNSSFAPIWTTRIPSTGASTSVSANGNSYLALSSRAPITGVSNWKPASPSLIVLTFDGKGLLKAATALPGLVKPISLHYSSARGVTGLATSSDGSISFFTLVSR